MDPALISRILAAYGLSGGQQLPPQKGYRNHSHPYQLASGHRLNVIIYKSEPDILQRIKRINQLSNQLFAAGMPVRRQQGPILQLQAGSQRRYAALYDYLPGETIPWEAYTRQHIKLLGKALSDMHAKLAGLDTGLPSVIDETEALTERMVGYLMASPVREALVRKLDVSLEASALNGFLPLLLECRGLPDHQPLHMDFVRGNILFSDRPLAGALYLNSDTDGTTPYISGILDLEKAAYGPPVFDVARTLAFLLVDCKYKQPHKVIKYFIDSGYQKRGSSQLPPGQINLLNSLTKLYLLHDFYKFLRHNPYEYLPQNEHFVRTRDFLLKDGIIKSTS